MTEFLIRLFIKDYENVSDTRVRAQYGTLSGMTGIVCNFMLSVIKLITGIITGAFSIAADAVNNLSDTASSVVTIVGFRLSGKSADREHPYGHGRAEYISGFVVSAAVIAVALELLKTSVSNIIHKNEMDVSIATIIILICTILVKCWMSYFYFKISKKINSAAMKATATDSLADCITTGVALVSVIVMLVFKVNIDGIAGAIVSIIVIISGFSTAMETINPLIGTTQDKELTERIRNEALSHPEVIGVHDIRLHEYGPGRLFATFDAELPCTMEMIEAHEIITDIEEALKSNGSIQEVTIHIDPVAVDDEERILLKEFVTKVLFEFDKEISIHDFRIRLHDEKKFAEFDVVIPYDAKYSDSDVCNLIQSQLYQHHSCFAPAVIHIDKS